MRSWKLPVFLVLIIACIVMARLFGFEQHFTTFRHWISEQGALGPVLFAAAYALATVLAMPGAVLTIMAGALFGSVIGVISVLVGATIGAALCFLIARYAMRDMVAERLMHNANFQRLDALTEKHGDIIVAITRLVPIFPFNLLNYGFGLTNISFKVYIFWTGICITPGTVLYVVGTDAITRSISEGTIPWPLVGIVCAVLCIIVGIARKAKARLKE